MHAKGGQNTSFIQTLLSALESHQICKHCLLAGFTAGTEFHRSLKVHYSLMMVSDETGVSVGTASAVGTG